MALIVVRVSASHAVGHGFASWMGHTKGHHKNGTNYLPDSTEGIKVRVRQCIIKDEVDCRTVYGDMHYKDLIGSFTRVG